MYEELRKITEGTAGTFKVQVPVEIYHRVPGVTAEAQDAWVQYHVYFEEREYGIKGMEVIIEQQVEVNWTEIGAPSKDTISAVERRTDKIMRIEPADFKIGWEDGWGVHPDRIRVYLNEQGAIEEAIIDFSFINPLKRP